MNEIFLKVRDIVMGYTGVRESKSANQTTYKDRYQSILHLRFNDEKVTIALARGTQLQEKYPFLEGDGSVVRRWNLYKMSDLDEGILREIIEETMILNMEHYELKKLKVKSVKKMTKVCRF